MTNVFKRIEENSKTVILFVWPLAWIILAMSGILMWEDYSTSLAGYLALPTQKVHTGIVVFAVAFLPQAGQIVLFYIFGKNTAKGWALFLAGAFFLADLATDSWYKSGGNWGLMPLAIIESIFVFTLGSEVLFTIALGFILEAAPEFFVSLVYNFASIKNAFASAMEALGLSEVEQHYPQKNDYQQRNNDNRNEQRR